MITGKQIPTPVSAVAPAPGILPVSYTHLTVTPLQDLAALASCLGVKSIHCKDESYRFGLNAFKVLGGSYAMGRYIAKEVGKDISELPYAVLSSEALRKEFGQMCIRDSL